MAVSFYDIIRNAFPFNPTADQDNAMQALAIFLEDNGSERVFILKGYVGTGKTSLLAALAKALLEAQRRFFLVAPTRQAARLVSKQTSLPITTLYAHLYRSEKSSTGEISFVLREDAPPKNSLIIVDQAALVPNRPEKNKDGQLNPNNVLADLITYLKREPSSRVIFVGDAAQLSPLQEDISAALYGPALTQEYGLAHTNIELRRVTQKSSSSGPIISATYLRDMIDKSTFKEQRLAVLKTGDIHLINSDELMDSLGEAYARYGEEDVCLLCNTDRRAVRHNQRIRSSVFKQTSILREGERVVVARDYHQHPELQRLGIPFLGRGELLRVVSLGKIETRGEYTFQTIEIEFEQSNGETARLSALANTGTLLSQSAGFPKKDEQKLRASRKKSYEHLSKEEAAAALASDPYVNALQLKYGYAITADKARGGQWGHVFVDSENVFASGNQQESHRWFYTAITRSFDQLTMIDFPDDWVRYDVPREIEALIADGDDADVKATVVNPARVREIVEPLIEDEEIDALAAPEESPLVAEETPTLELDDLVTEEPAPWQENLEEAVRTPLEDLAPSFEEEPVSGASEELFQSFKEEPATFEDPDLAVSTVLDDLAPSFDEEEPVERRDYMADVSRVLRGAWRILLRLLALLSRIPRRAMVIAVMLIALVMVFPLVANFATTTVGNITAQLTQNAAALLASETPTPEPTATTMPTPTTTPMPLVLGCVEVRELRVRSGPATSFQQVGGLRFEECYEFDAINVERDWVRLREFEGVSDYGWVAIEFLEVIGDIDRLPVMEEDS
ncbi:MAG: hypothetical protein DWQ07_10460 [Chloroflexi bacterium]|nr:MAG: hypothetical protein DWQ07_10460 [Chloroflexota bacterium]MBL1192866.1 hypothetical protein [Chloroflexota bacterium]NOH10159.1 AAA family ATPase [Chloroflexota bacterium]